MSIISIINTPSSEVVTKSFLNATYMPLTGGTFTGDIIIPDEVYSSSWNGNLEAPTKNAVYDKLELIQGEYLKKDGSQAMTGNWNFGDYTFSVKYQIIKDVFGVSARGVSIDNSDTVITYSITDETGALATLKAGSFVVYNNVINSHIDFNLDDSGWVKFIQDDMYMSDVMFGNVECSNLYFDVDTLSGFTFSPQKVNCDGFSLEFPSDLYGPILTASDSSKWRIVVDTSGNLSTVAV